MKRKPMKKYDLITKIFRKFKAMFKQWGIKVDKSQLKQFFESIDSNQMKSFNAFK